MFLAGLPTIVKTRCR